MNRPDNKRFYLWLGAGALALALLTAPAGAAERLEPLKWTHVDGMSFVSGGIGMRERRELFNNVHRYDVLLSFAGRDNGGFLTNVRVDLSRLSDSGESVARVALFSAGPYMFAQLPAGKYELTASLQGWYSSHYTFEARPHHHERIFVTLAKRTLPESATISMR